MAEPDIKAFKVRDEHDFILLGCDGIFDKLENMEIVQQVWETARKSQGVLHQVCGECVEMVLKGSVAKRTLDNITVVIIAFNNMKKGINRKSSRYNSLASNTSKRPDPLEPNLDLAYEDLDPTCPFVQNSTHSRLNAPGADQFAAASDDNKQKYASDAH